MAYFLPFLIIISLYIPKIIESSGYVSGEYMGLVDVVV